MQERIQELEGKIVAMPRVKRQLTDEEIAQRCPTCQFVKVRCGVFMCTRKTCKYRTSRKSRYFKDK